MNTTCLHMILYLRGAQQRRPQSEHIERLSRGPDRTACGNREGRRKNKHLPYIYVILVSLVQSFTNVV